MTSDCHLRVFDQSQDVADTEKGKNDACDA
jgi:hypothetical protein